MVEGFGGKGFRDKALGFGAQGSKDLGFMVSGSGVEGSASGHTVSLVTAKAPGSARRILGERPSNDARRDGGHPHAEHGQSPPPEVRGGHAGHLPKGCESAHGATHDGSARGHASWRCW